MLEHKHLIIKGDTLAKFTSDNVRELLTDLVVELDMELIQSMEGSNPNVGFQDGADCGVTGCALITTSHIVLHTWDKTMDFQMDIYSCKKFDPKAIIEWLAIRGLLTNEKRFFDRSYQIIDDERN